jgi:hypothetical protein
MLFVVFQYHEQDQHVFLHVVVEFGLYDRHLHEIYVLQHLYINDRILQKEYSDDEHDYVELLHVVDVAK